MGIEEKNLIAQTEMDGSFVIPSSPRSVRRICASHIVFGSGAVDVDLNSAEKTIEIRISLQKPGAIRGIIRSDRPSSDEAYSMTIRHDLWKEGVELPFAPPQDGTFLISGIVPGEVNVSLWSGDRLSRHSASQSRQAIVRSGETTDIQFYFERGTAVLEAKSYLNGAPHYAHISLSVSGIAQSESISTSNDEVHFEFRDLLAGRATLLINASVPAGSSTWMQRRLEVELEDNKTTTVDIEWSGGAKLQGYVSAVDRSNAVFVWVYEGDLVPTRTDRFSALFRSFCDETGRYLVTGLAPGVYTVEAGTYNVDERSSHVTITLQENESRTLDFPAPQLQ